MRGLFELQRDFMKMQAETAYNAALSRLSDKVPPIRKDGRIVVKGVERSRYSKLETINEVLKPLMAEEGFSLSFNEEAVDGSRRNFTATLKHKGGHSETFHKSMPFDQNEFRSGPQSEGSTTAYARRQLTKMIFNVDEVDEDDDGTGKGAEAISGDQVKDLEALMDEVKADKARFLNHFKLTALTDLLQRDYSTAIRMLEDKRRSMK
jgi:hypothetical protein